MTALIVGAVFGAFGLGLWIGASGRQLSSYQEGYDAGTAYQRAVVQEALTKTWRAS